MFTITRHIAKLWLWRRAAASGTPDAAGLYYGWVVVGAATVAIMIHVGLMQSYAVFFKPMSEEFGWSRGTTAGGFSLGLILGGIASAPVGYLVDRLGPNRVLLLAGIVEGFAILLASQVTAIWQLYLIRGLMFGVASAGTALVCSAVPARWFAKRRGLALGIVSAGASAGLFVTMPLVERLSAAVGWADAYLVLGVVGLVGIVGASFLMKLDPREVGRLPDGDILPPSAAEDTTTRARPMPASSSAIRPSERLSVLLMLVGTYFLFNYSIQVVTLHLVNYATDRGITALLAATFLSILGVGGLIGRLASGLAADRFGCHNILAITLAMMTLSMPLLMLASEPWVFVLSALLVGLSQGGLGPEIPALAVRYFGLPSVGTVTGAVFVGTGLGGALGGWAAGFIFDSTGSYMAAFLITMAVGTVALSVALALRRQPAHEVCLPLPQRIGPG